MKKSPRPQTVPPNSERLGTADTTLDFTLGDIADDLDRVPAAGIQKNGTSSQETGRPARGGKGFIAMALLVIALSWGDEAQANQEVRQWNEVMAQMEPLSVFFMNTRLAPLLHVAIHDALNSIPETARYHTYRPPVATQGPASPEAALAAAGRTMLLNYIDFFSDPNLPPDFYNPNFQNFIPLVESVYNLQLAAIPEGPAKTEGIRIGEAAAEGLWLERLGDGWNNPHGLVFQFPNNDGDNDPTTGLPGEYVQLVPPEPP